MQTTHSLQQQDQFRFCNRLPVTSSHSQPHLLGIVKVEVYVHNGVYSMCEVSEALRANTRGPL
jgi:hypothetical protein